MNLKNYLTPYQKRFIRDDSKRIIVLKGRRIGLSEAAAVKSIKKCQETPGHDVHLVSMSYREAKELLRTAAKWVEVLQAAGSLSEDIKVTATKVEFPNRSRILALPAKAVRSRGGTVVLDETAKIERAREVFEGIAPAVEADDEGQLILISTPLGESGLFHDIYKDDGTEYGEWSRYKIDIYQAYSEGADWLPEPDKLKEQYPNDVWLQEFCCQFLGDRDQYFEYDLLRSSMISEEEIPDEAEEQYVGIDLGSTSDASVLVRLMVCEGTKYISDVQVIKKPGQSKHLSEQQQEIDSYLRSTPVDCVAVDGAGIGTQLAEDLERSYGAVTVWDTGTWRTEPPSIVPKMKQELEEGNLRMISDSSLLTAFASIKRKERTNRSVKFEADRNQEGHADAFFAALMAFNETVDNDVDWVFL